MKTQAYKSETVKSEGYRGDAGSIFIAFYIGIIIFFFLLGTLSSFIES